jgi:hypothetical protein
MADFEIVYAVPTVQIERRGFGYEVHVLTERSGPAEGFGWTGWAWTRRGAELLAQRLLADPPAVVHG